MQKQSVYINAGLPFMQVKFDDLVINIVTDSGYYAAL